MSDDSHPPEYLYKILTLEDWKQSEGLEQVHLPSADIDFIHLATEEQLSKIIRKYWFEAPAFIVIEFEVSKLPGELRLECNPGGTTPYYHLYNGFLPQKAIASYEIQKK